jgi:hypothetical protein
MPIHFAEVLRSSCDYDVVSVAAAELERHSPSRTAGLYSLYGCEGEQSCTSLLSIISSLVRKKKMKRRWPWWRVEIHSFAPFSDSTNSITVMEIEPDFGRFEIRFQIRFIRLQTDCLSPILTKRHLRLLSIGARDSRKASQRRAEKLYSIYCFQYLIICTHYKAV